MLSSVSSYVSNQAQNLVLASKKSGASKDFATQFASALKSEDSKKLYKACQDLESVFVNTVVKTMRQSIQKGGLVGNSFAEETYQSMLDEEYSKQISQTKTLGVADMLYKQLSQNISDEVNEIKSALAGPSSSSQPTASTQENTSSDYGTTTVTASSAKSDNVKNSAPLYELSDTTAATETENLTPQELFGTDCVAGPAKDKYIDFSEPHWQLKWNEMWGQYNQVVTQSTNPNNVGKKITALNWGNEHPVIYAQQYATGRLTNSQGNSIEVGALDSGTSSYQTSNSYPNSSSSIYDYNDYNDYNSSTSNSSDPDYSDGWAS